jgi:Gram-negative bacterial TonB protein C-terminal/BlaR1 peptidase M56
MNILWYLIKMFFVSSVFYGYYCFALRNKKFHGYNRFYLGITVFISLILPLVNIPILFNEPGDGSAVRMLHILSVNQWEEAVTITPNANWLAGMLSWQHISMTAYFLVSLFLLILFARNMNYIWRIAKKYGWETIDNIRLFYTYEPQAPFSFFRNIFWNAELDITSREGRQILRHEVYHVQKKHSIDILLMEVICCLCWFNPVFHFIKKEIRTIHEFLADEYASSGADKFSYAELLVWQNLSVKQLVLINPFFHNQIKRRINMITQLKNKRYHYGSRLMALPVLFILFCAFSIKTMNMPRVDALPGTLGKDDTLFHSMETYLVKHLYYPQASLKSNYAATVNLKVTVDATGKCKSISPIAGIPADTKFFAVTVTSKSKFEKAGFKAQVTEPGFDRPEFIPFKEMVTNTLSSFKSDQPVSGDITLYLRVSFKIEQNNKTGFEITKPATTSGGTAYIRPIKVDTIPNISKITPDEIERIEVTSKAVLFYKKDNVVTQLPRTTTEGANSFAITLYGNELSQILLYENALVFVKKDNSNLIVTLNKSGERPHGTAGNDPIFSKVEVEAEYPGGPAAWQQYLLKTFKYPDEAVNYELQGDVNIRFIVDREGNVSDVVAETGPLIGGLREEGIRVIQNSGKWIPAVQNGHPVTAFKTQPIRFKLQQQ